MKLRRRLQDFSDDPRSLNCHEIIKSKRLPQNLKRILTKARFDENEPEATITQCGRPNCSLCHHLIIEKIYRFKCGKRFKVKSHMSCNVRKNNLCHPMWGI